MCWAASNKLDEIYMCTNVEIAQHKSTLSSFLINTCIVLADSTTADTHNSEQISNISTITDIWCYLLLDTSHLESLESVHSVLNVSFNE